MMARNTDGREQGGGESPVVSVIVPARNEELCLGRCLESLAAQPGVAFEILLVDDGSTDRTRAIAQSFAEVQVLDAGPLPRGWTGKNHACWQGAQHARGKWLLFTDADTVHQPGSLATSLAEAEQHGAALLSYSPRQEVAGFWQRALMPVIFAELAATYPPSQVCDPQSPAAANGQYLMISREAYDAVGGHRAVAGSLLEDVALARRVKKSGRGLRFRYGGEAVRTRMYRSLEQMWEGWTKNLALLFEHPIRMAGLRSLEFLGVAGGVAVALGAFATGREMAGSIALLIALAVWGAFLLRIRRAHFGASENALAVFGLPLFALLLLNSQRHHGVQGSVRWKGRAYPQVRSEEAGEIRSAETQPLETTR